MQAPDDGNFEFITAAQSTGLENYDAAKFRGIQKALHHANVAKVILIHGTFAGNDVLGLIRELGRVLPGTADSLRALGKRLIDQVTGSLGNYTENFANRLDSVLNEGVSHNIEVSRFAWSGETIT